MRLLFRKAEIARQYTRCRFHGYRLLVRDRGLDERFLQMCCVRPERMGAGFEAVNSSVCARVFRFEFDGAVYFHKTYLPRNGMEPIKDIFLGSRAERALIGDLILEANGFCTPEAVVVGIKGSHNFTVSRMIPNPLPLREYFHNLRVSGFRENSIVRGRRTIAEFGQTIGQLHARGISHGDLRWGNIIIDSSNSDNFRYVLLDNERTRRYSRLPDRKRLKNLVQLNLVPDVGISGTDRLRFFYGYLEANPELEPHRKEWIRRVLARTRFRLEQKARKRGVSGGSR